MKFKSLFLMALVAMAFTACSKDDDLQGGGEDQGIEEKGEAYASLSFAMPGGAMTKAAGDPKPGQGGNGTENGTEAENAVNNVTIIGFNVSGGNRSFIESINRSQLTPSGTGASVVYKTVKPFTVPIGSHYVYVVVNKGASIVSGEKNISDFPESITLDEFEASTFSGYETLGKYMMTNADPVRDKIVVVNAENTATNPISINVNVERAMAKITYKAINDNNIYAYTKENESNSSGTITLKYCKLINFSNSSFLFRRTAWGEESKITGKTILGGKEEDPNIYVVDHNMGEKNLDGVKFGDNPAYPTGMETYYTNLPILYNSENATVLPSESAAAGWGGLPTAKTDSHLSYCLENTFFSAFSLKGYGTGIIFQAQYIFNGKESAVTFYRYEGNLYENFDNLAKAYNRPSLDVNLWLTVEKHDPFYKGADKAARIEILKARSIDTYENGYCYYPYFIRHANNGDPTKTGIMEFAMVRNNVYKLTVNSIKEIGYPTEHIRPEEPIEDAEPKLDVTVTVLPWVVRNNDIEL